MTAAKQPKAASYAGVGSTLSRSPKVASRLAHRLVDEILSGDLADGNPLPPEREMAAAYGVGRTTVREALRVLENLGAVSIRAGRNGGPFVRRPRARDLSGPLTLLFQFDQASMLDVLRARQVLEPSLSRLAAERATDEQIEAMHATVVAVQAAPEDHEQYVLQNERFHNLVGEASGSPILRLFSDSLQSIADGGSVGFHYAAKQRLATAEFHLRITERIEARDGAGAEQCMAEHLIEAGDFWKRRYPDEVARTIRWLD